ERGEHAPAERAGREEVAVGGAEGAHPDEHVVAVDVELLHHALLSNGGPEVAAPFRGYGGEHACERQDQAILCKRGRVRDAFVKRSSPLSECELPATVADDADSPAGDAARRAHRRKRRAVDGCAGATDAAHAIACQERRGMAGIAAALSGNG